MLRSCFTYSLKNVSKSYSATTGKVRNKLITVILGWKVETTNVINIKIWALNLLDC